MLRLTAQVSYPVCTKRVFPGFFESYSLTQRSVAVHHALKDDEEMAWRQVMYRTSDHAAQGIAQAV